MWDWYSSNYAFASLLVNLQYVLTLRLMLNVYFCVAQASADARPVVSVSSRPQTVRSVHPRVHSQNCAVLIVLWLTSYVLCRVRAVRSLRLFRATTTLRRQAAQPAPRPQSPLHPRTKSYHPRLMRLRFTVLCIVTTKKNDMGCVALCRAQEYKQTLGIEQNKLYLDNRGGISYVRIVLNCTDLVFIFCRVSQRKKTKIERFNAVRMFSTCTSSVPSVD